jgi:hypothetical protein
MNALLCQGNDERRTIPPGVQKGLILTILLCVFTLACACSPILFFPTAAPEPTATPPFGPTAYRLEIQPNREWTRTELELEEGQGIELLAGGKVRLSQDSRYNQLVGPWGFETPCTVNEGNPCALDGAPYGGLIGRIGDGEPFYLGGEKTFVSPRSGYLYLATNDNYGMYADNSGFFFVLLTVESDYNEGTAFLEKAAQYNIDERPLASAP